MSFASLPLWGNLLLFAAAAAAVWAAGTRIAGYADDIAEATGIGRAVLGLLLLAGVTSLPELAVATTATLAGHPTLSINDVLGSAAINILIIALADALIGRDAITSVLASPPVLLQGVLGMILLAMVMAGALIVDVPLLGASAWTWMLMTGYAGSVWMIARSNSGTAWTAQGAAPAPEGRDEPGPLRPLVLKTVIAAVVVLGAGFVLAKAAEGIAEQTGLGTNIVGAVLLAASTSLPEVSTVLGAVRRRRYEMAVSDIFGTNLCNVTIIFIVDMLHDGGPVLQEAGRFAGFAALLALVLTGLYLAGMIERRNRTVLRMGYDSLAAVIVYAAGLSVLFTLK